MGPPSAAVFRVRSFGPGPLKRLPRGKVAKATKVANDGEMGILGSSPS